MTAPLSPAILVKPFSHRADLSGAILKTAI